MYKWHSHVTKTRHLASQQNRPAFDQWKRTRVGHFLRLRQAGPPIQSQFSLHYCVSVFFHRLVFSTGRVARTLQLIRLLSISMTEQYSLSTWVYTLKGGRQKNNFSGGKIGKNEYTSKNSKNVNFDCIMNVFFDERNNGVTISRLFMSSAAHWWWSCSALVYIMFGPLPH